MLTAKKHSLVTAMNVKDVRVSADANKNGISEAFCESFHEASMVAIQEIKKGKKPKFVQVA